MPMMAVAGSPDAHAAGGASTDGRCADVKEMFRIADEIETKKSKSEKIKQNINKQQPTIITTTAIEFRNLI